MKKGTIKEKKQTIKAAVKSGFLFLERLTLAHSIYLQTNNKNKMITNRKNSIRVLTAVKFTPVISSFAMLLLTIQLLLGADYNEVEALRGLFAFSTGGTLLLFLSSYFLRLCNLHRLFIIYTEGVSDALAFENGVGFGEYLNIALNLGLIFGLLLFTYLFLKFNNFCNTDE